MGIIKDKLTGAKLEVAKLLAESPYHPGDIRIYETRRGLVVVYDVLILNPNNGFVEGWAEFVVPIHIKAKKKLALIGEPKVRGGWYWRWWPWLRESWADHIYQGLDYVLSDIGGWKTYKEN